MSEFEMNIPLFLTGGGALLVIALVTSIEAALHGVPEARVRGAIKKGLSGAEGLDYWVRARDQILSTLHLALLASVLWLGAVVVPKVSEVSTVSLLVVASGVLAVTLVCVLIPRHYARAYALDWARRCMPLVRGVVTLAWPVVYPLRLVARQLARPFGDAAAFWGPEEIARISTDARHDELGEPDEDLLLSIIEFSDTVIREIMVPRTEMVAIPLGSSPDEIRNTATQAGHSRIPAYSDTVDNIIGVLHVKDLFRFVFKGDTAAADFDLKSFLRPSFYVPEVMQISELLKEFQRRQTHMAIVVDEYGGTAGVVTLEDIIEEIVGEIQDEYDVEEKQFRVLTDSKILADGRVNLSDLEDVLDVEFPEDSSFETLAGFLVARTGYLPQVGAVITWNNLRFTVKEANEKRIATVEIDSEVVGTAVPASTA